MEECQVIDSSNFQTLLVWVQRKVPTSQGKVVWGTCNNQGKKQMIVKRGKYYEYDIDVSFDDKEIWSTKR